MADHLKILDRGDIYFVYRPKVERETVKDLQDVQRFSLILKSQKKGLFSIIALGKKRVPSQDVERVEFAFVQHVVSSSDDLAKELDEETYDTLTRGERHLPAARAVAEGKYLITQHDDVSCLDYQLESHQVGEAQRKFALAPRAQYLIFVKNPKSDPDKGLPPEERARYSDKLQSHFRGIKFIPLPDAEFLQTVGAELLLIDDKAQSPDLDREVYRKALSSFPHASVEKELSLKKTAISDAPLRKGKLT